MLLGCLVAAGLVATPIEAVALPVPADDSYRTYASGEYTFDVLANDDTSLLSTDDLTLCGVTVGDAARQVLYAEIDRTDPSRVYVEVNRNAAGVVRFTYDACQGEQRATSSVTLDISLLTSPTVRKPHRRGRITATNPNKERLTILWGSNRTNANDGRRGLVPGRRTTIEVARSRVYWVAYLVDRGSVMVAGDGSVTRIKRARQSRPAPGIGAAGS